MGRVCRLTLPLLACLFLGASEQAQSPSSTQAPDDEIRYTLFLGPRNAGVAAVKTEADGWLVVRFEVSDRGRGQKLLSRYLLDGNGVPRKTEITGVDYWQNPVDEHFERKGDLAVWRNATESGERKLSGPAFYLSAYGLHEIGLLATALLHTPERRLPLLPSGEARLEKVGGPVQVGTGDRARTLDLYALTGLGYTPYYMWMEGDLFFARFEGFASAIREGWEDVLPELIRRHGEAMAAWQKGLATQLARRPAQGFAIRGARLFDPATGKVRSGLTVIISGNRVQAVGPDGELAVPPGAEIMEAHGRMLLPGLWDMHQHFTADDGLLDLAAGVTSGRDMANDTDRILSLKRLWDSGEAIGPRVMMAGVIEGPGPYAAPTQMLATTEAEAVAIVDRYAQAGFHQVKIYSSLDPKLVPAIAARAHAKGLRVSGHIPYGMKAEQAVREGYDEVQHANFLFLNFLEGVDTRTPARMAAVAEQAATLDVNSEPFRALLRLIKEKGVVVDPTVNIFEDRFLGRTGVVVPTMAAIADRLPPMERRELFVAGLPKAQEMGARFRESFRNILALVRALYEQGIPIVAGTDSQVGFNLHRELELYVEAGLPAPDVLRIATLDAAKIMKQDQDLGTIAPGKLADLILVDGDPTVRISDIRRVSLTVKDGVIYNPAELYRAVGVRPAG